MLLCDVNILIYAHREDTLRHQAYKEWFGALINSDETFVLSELVLSGFIRIVTHPKIFDPPSSLADALSFVNTQRELENCRIVVPGSRHWEIFQRLCTESNAKGNLISGAYHAALAIETGSEWVTADRGFARYPGLRWHNPV